MSRGQPQSQDQSTADDYASTSQCLVCRGSYDSSNYRLKRIACLRSVKDTTVAFELFQKLVLNGVPASECETVSVWNFSVECLPFCSNCTRTVFQLERLNQSLKKIQLELQEKLELVRTKIIQSQCRQESQVHISQGKDSGIEATKAVEADERVEQFRRLVIQRKSDCTKNCCLQE